jgi:hypothetical protein
LSLANRHYFYGFNPKTCGNGWRSSGLQMGALRAKCDACLACGNPSQRGIEVAKIHQLASSLS